MTTRPAFTETERRFMTAIDEVVAAGLPISDRDARSGEQYASFLPTAPFSKCPRAVIGFANRPVDGFDIGVGLDDTSAYCVQVPEPVHQFRVVNHLFYLRHGNIYRRELVYTPEQGNTGLDFSDHIELTERAGEQAATWHQMVGKGEVQEPRTFMDVSWEQAVGIDTYGYPFEKKYEDEFIGWLGSAVPNFISLG